MPHRAKLLATITPVVNRVHADRTDGQRVAIAAAVADHASFAMCRRDGIAFPQEFEVELLATGVLQRNPAFTREVPSPQQIADALAKDWTSKLGSCPQQKVIVWFRTAQKATPDERLKMIGDLPVDVPTAKAESAPTSAGKALTSDDEIDGELARRRGLSLEAFHANTSPQKVLALRQYLRKETPPRKAAAGINPHDPAFLALSPTERIRRFRAASK